MGQISATQNGNKLVVAIFDLNVYELFDFDRSTGVLSNLITISSCPKAWGAEFSPNGNALYTTQWGGSGAADVRQFDLSSNNQTTINASATIIGTATSPDPNYKAGYLQIGPDNKIYLAKFTSGYVGVINSPNTVGTGCNYIDNGVYLSGKTCEAGLPSFMQTYVDASGIAENISSSNSISVYPNPLTKESLIEINGSHTDNFSIELYDLYGKKILGFANCRSPFKLKNLNLSTGTYFLKAFDEKEIIGVKKIVIQ
jgi:hypothetical protein